MAGSTASELEQRAEEARVVAEQMRDPRSKRSMMNVALSYERLAKHASTREAREPPSRMLLRNKTGTKRLSGQRSHRQRRAVRSANVAVDRCEARTYRLNMYSRKL